MSTHPKTRLLLLPGLVALALGGCATKEFVQQEVGVVNTRIDELSSLLATTNQRIDAHMTRIGAAENRILAAEHSAKALGQRLDQTQAGLAEAGQRLDGVSTGLKSAEQRLTANEAEIARAHRRLDGVEAQLHTTSQQVSGSVARIGEAQTRIETLENSLKALVQPAAVASPPAQAPAVTALSVPPAPPSGEPSRRLDEIAAQIATASQRIEAQATALNAASERLNVVETSLADARKRVEVSESGLDAANKRITEAQGQLASAEQRIASNTEAIASIARRVDGVEADLARTGQQLASAERSLAASGEKMVQIQTTLAEHAERLAKNEAEDARISTTAREALERAIAAGKLAEGKLVYETALSETFLGFRLNQANLSPEAQQALKALADKLKADNQNVYIEIQGHTDNLGPAEFNHRLGLQRAEAVRDFLLASGIPLHRMAVVSYGPRQPVASNATREGRSKNRRVVLVVLK